MHFSKALVNGLALCLSTCAIAAADSPQLSRALNDANTVVEHVKSATTAVNNYQGGVIAAIPVGKKFYNAWTSLQQATKNVEDGSAFTSEDSKVLISEIENLEPIIREGMEASGNKIPALDKAGISFVQHALHEGVKRDYKNYLSAVQVKLPENEQSKTEDLGAVFDEIHDSAFGA